MATFEAALDDCLKRISSGEAGVQDCLKLYPEHAEKLRPLLESAARMKAGAPRSGTSVPGPGAEVPRFADSGARRRRGLAWYATPTVRLIAVVVLIMICLFVGGSAYAQTTYPGDMLYGWKRASESAARLASPVLVDLWLSQRRANEVLAVRNETHRLVIAWAAYREVMNRLMAYNGDPVQAAHIAAVLRAQWEAFVQAGVPLPTGAAALPPVPTASPTPTSTPTPGSTSAATLPGGSPTSTLTGGTSRLTATPTDYSLPTAPRPPTFPPTWTPAPTWTPFPSPSMPVFPTFPPPTFAFPTP